MKASRSALFALSTCALIFGAACNEKKSSVSEKPTAKLNTAGAPGAAPEGMVWIPGGEFQMGADERGSYKMARPTNEGPVHPVAVDGFWMDAR